uniref:Uncharacterized protein n=1 Tax=Oryza sativa subsp. japonica TaxID=39947 RepID=Q69X38_ORYSJ|nr:hypothetical protein [Oryza sativa Japonica Group]
MKDVINVASRLDEVGNIMPRASTLDVTHTHGDGQRRHGAYRPVGSGDGGAERGGCHGRPAMDATHEIRQLSSAELS